MKPKTPRLKIQYSFVNKFDFIDKGKFCNFARLNVTKLNKLFLEASVKSSNNSVAGSRQPLSSVLFLEWLCNQRLFSTFRKKKIFLRNEYFLATLRKDQFYLFLEFCLNSVFVGENTKFSYKNRKLVFLDKDLFSKIHLFYPSKLLSNLPETHSDKVDFSFHRNLSENQPIENINLKLFSSQLVPLN